MLDVISVLAIMALIVMIAVGPGLVYAANVRRNEDRDNGR
jgi:hypothetical protein